MRNTLTGLASAAVSAVALAAVGAGIAMFGATPTGLAIGGGVAAGLALTLMLHGKIMDRRQALAVSALAAKAGSIGKQSHAAVVDDLLARLEEAARFNQAFRLLQRPSLIFRVSGEIDAASAGILAIDRGLDAGRSIEQLFGPGFLSAGGGVAQEFLLNLAGSRYEAHSHDLGGGSILLELVPAGHVISDDDLDSFVTALAGGQTGFRFASEEDVPLAPALVALNDGMIAIDRSAAAIDDLAAGRLDEAELSRNDGLSPQVRAMHRALASLTADRDALVSDRDEEADRRTTLEDKLSEIGQLVERYHAHATELSREAGTAQALVSKAGETVAAGRLLADRVSNKGKTARALALEAEMAARRTHRAVGDVDTMTREIDGLVASIEEVSYRTNLLALNAAVEAARAGEKGAGFVVVAEEVRTLAQITNRSAREIRAMVSRGRAQTGAGANEAQVLHTLVTTLDAHLRNLSDETDTIAAALGASGNALSEVGGQMAGITQAAEQAAAMSAAA